MNQNNKEQSSVDPQHLDATADSLMTKRTEYLELQERRIAATVNEQKTETQNLSDATKAIMKQTRKLHTEMQFVYAKTKCILRGKECKGDAEKTLAEIRKLNGKHEFEKVADPDTWVMLAYPMEPLEIYDGIEYVMRCKTVNKNSGQITVYWVVVYEKQGGREKRSISEFSMYPF